MSSIENKASAVSVPFFPRKLSDFARYQTRLQDSGITVIGAKGPEAV
jgi:hypothetical protein